MGLHQKQGCSKIKARSAEAKASGAVVGRGAGGGLRVSLFWVLCSQRNATRGGERSTIPERKPM